jgi:ribosome-binding protein aMBF1 (putative translation factor)
MWSAVASAGGVFTASPRCAHSYTSANALQYPRAYFMQEVTCSVARMAHFVLVPPAMKSSMRVPSGDLIAAARRAVGLSQIELARSAGIGQSTLSRMEGAGSKPVHALSQNLEAVLEALRKAGVELPDENTIRLVKRRR